MKSPNSLRGDLGMAIRWRLSDEDWQLFGGPEWLVLDFDAFGEMTWKQLDELENADTGMGMSIRRARLLIADGSARGIKAALWLARVTSGDPALKLAWDEFDLIRPLKAKAQAVLAEAGEADPPDLSSPVATAGEQTSESESPNNSAEVEPSGTSSAD